MRIAMLVTLAALTIVQPTAAQDLDAFSVLEIELGAGANLTYSSLADDWEPGPGGVARVETPFHEGYLATGLRVLPYRSQTQVPAFRAALIYASWGRSVFVSEPVRVRIGGRVGNLQMYFEEETVSGIRNESELTVGIEAIAQLRLAGSTSLQVAWSQERTFTRRGMSLGYLSVGVVHSIRTPDWLKRILE